MALRGQRGDATVCAHAAHSATPCNPERGVGRGARGDRGTRAGKAGPRPQVRGCRLIQVVASGKHQLFSGRPGGLRSLRPRGPSPPTAPESGFHGRGVTGTLEEGAASPSRRPREGLSQTGAPPLLPAAPPQGAPSWRPLRTPAGEGCSGGPRFKGVYTQRQRPGPEGAAGKLRAERTPLGPESPAGRAVCRGCGHGPQRADRGGGGGPGRPRACLSPNRPLSAGVGAHGPGSATQWVPP